MSLTLDFFPFPFSMLSLYFLSLISCSIFSIYIFASLLDSLNFLTLLISPFSYYNFSSSFSLNFLYLFCRSTFSLYLPIKFLTRVSSPLSYSTFVLMVSHSTFSLDFSVSYSSPHFLFISQLVFSFPLCHPFLSSFSHFTFLFYIISIFSLHFLYPIPLPFLSPLSLTSPLYSLSLSPHSHSTFSIYFPFSTFSRCLFCLHFLPPFS